MAAKKAGRGAKKSQPAKKRATSKPRAKPKSGNASAKAFVRELRALVRQHYGVLPPDEVEPFGMALRQALPVVGAAAARDVTTTATISLPLDTDPPDQD